jgi:tRNA(Arg) A34 adenosine deaminase TadA
MYMRAAIEWSRRGMDNDNMGPVGAVIVRDGVILGQGHNRMIVDMDVTAHGEMVAIRDGIQRAGNLEALQGATIYTNTQPCPMCYTACKWAGITRIVYALSCADTYEIGRDYGFLDVEMYEDVRKDEHQRSIPQSQVLRHEALPVLEDWARINARLRADS